jgi:DNA-directed RNA polymerase subunit delta
VPLAGTEFGLHGSLTGTIRMTRAVGRATMSIGGHQVPGEGTGDDGFDEEGYDESQRAEILEVTRDGPSDGTLLTDISPDMAGEDDDDDDLSEDELGEEDDADESDDDADEDDVQDEVDDGTVDDDELSDRDDAALRP